MNETALSLGEDGHPRLGGGPMKLPPLERAVLSLLLRRSPGVVSKDDFADGAWRGRPMSDESLARCVSRLRAALLPHGVRLEAVYGTGYRLLQPSFPEMQAGHAYARDLLRQRTPAAVDRAIRLLRDAVRESPAHAASRVSLAEALATAVGWGQLPTLASVDEGLQVLDGLRTADDPTAAAASSARGALLDLAWRFDEADAAFERALALAAPHADTLLARGRHLLYTGRAAEAVERLRQARLLSPYGPILRITLSRALAQDGRGEEALAEAHAAAQAHPGELFVSAFAMAMQAMVAPAPELESAARRLFSGFETPPFAWTVSSFVFARLGLREEALDIVDAALLCSATTTGEATLYAAPLASLGEHDRAAALLARACEERCGMLAMVLRDPAHAGWLPRHAEGRRLLAEVFGAAAY